jgi:hypothetical protein
MCIIEGFALCKSALNIVKSLALIELEHMTNGIIAIEGNHMSDLESIFQTFRYNDTLNDMKFDSYDKHASYLFENYHELSSKGITIRGVWYENNWTIISDPEFTDLVSADIIEKLAKKFNTRVLTFMIQSTSATFGYSLYNPSIERQFIVSDGDICENNGTPLPEEKEIDLNHKIFSDEITKLATNFGVDINGTKGKEFVVKQFEYNDELKSEMEQFRLEHSKKKKPWWKFF